jgi:hypothetical protein
MDDCYYEGFVVMDGVRLALKAAKKPNAPLFTEGKGSTSRIDQ